MGTGEENTHRIWIIPLLVANYIKLLYMNAFNCSVNFWIDLICEFSLFLSVLVLGLEHR